MESRAKLERMRNILDSYFHIFGEEDNKSENRKEYIQFQLPNQNQFHRKASMKEYNRELEMN